MAPIKPTDVKIEIIEQGVRISWGFAPPDVVKHRIFRQKMTTMEVELKGEVLYDPLLRYWDDPQGSDLYRYFVTAVDINGGESDPAGPVYLTSAPPIEICRIGGKFVGQNGSPEVGKDISAKIIKLPYGYGGKYWDGQELKKQTNSDGIVEFHLPRLSKVVFFSMAFGINKTVLVPNRESIDLIELIQS